MAIGDGDYDDLTTYVREHAEAEAVVVIVLGGQHGSGFSVQAPAEHIEQLKTRIPDILRALAEHIEVDVADQSHRHETRN